MEKWKLMLLAEIGELQMEMAAEFGVSDETLITVEFNDVSIIDLFEDETGRCEVDPIEYYGVELVNKYWAKVEEIMNGVNIKKYDNKVIKLINRKQK